MYSSGKLYKLQHEDGHFYIGSTCAELRTRLQGHKKKAKERPNQKVYKHINNEWDSIRMILIEDYPCENKQQLLKREDEFIQKELDNPLCLNCCRVILTPDEVVKYNRTYNREHYEKYKEYHKEYRKKYDRTEYFRQYRMNKKLNTL